MRNRNTGLKITSVQMKTYRPKRKEAPRILQTFSVEYSVESETFIWVYKQFLPLKKKSTPAIKKNFPNQIKQTSLYNIINWNISYILFSDCLLSPHLDM